jgi:cyclopropane-fatty-acyl-phospholipid synthase
MNAVKYAERGFLPMWLIRIGIRQRLRKRLEMEAGTDSEKKQHFINLLKNSPIAIATDAANEQHYELPSEFFELFMGEHMKYSSGYWPQDNMTLDESEEAALSLVAERSQLAPGQKVLELGCGWGSFSLWAAAKYPTSSFLAVSNSRSQAEYIRNKAESNDIHNLEVVTADMNDFAAPGLYDRVVSIEMFEHMRNYEKLLEKVAKWMNKNALLFVHIFSHKDHAYSYESADKDDWMANYFFTGGIMPSHDLLSYFDKDLKITQSWLLNGRHYHKTLESWLDRFNQALDDIRKIFGETYGQKNADVWIWRWRLFFLACSELFAINEGNEWGVSHYLLRK